MSRVEDVASAWFWEIIARAARDRARLRGILLTLSEKDVRRFLDEFEGAAAELKDEPYLGFIDPNESEDGVDDIARWTVSQGREVFQNILNHPDAIAKHVDVAEEANLFGVADEVYEERFGSAE